MNRRRGILSKIARQSRRGERTTSIPYGPRISYRRPKSPDDDGDSYREKEKAAYLGAL